ncbi:protein kinase domain-containing protein [Agaribacter marinus]|uniref:non-specific serine/threonine protein kinase n=1 Tax=Agaribacter marinus TaxID=1431249 RepID=A0AA37T080_9ALTE|nr:protein kinase [Agaribacter marinus]GLR71909.1 hypothetical protein GCM10007852_28170 [Agaribacter marinus]
MADDMLNRKIGRYEIQELIGEGAMAMVYRAYDPEINRSVACKILKADHCVDEEYMSRFLREAKAAGALSHSAIVTVFDVGKIDESPYIMMELLQGSDLGDVLKEKKTLSVKDTITIGLQLAKALDYAHSTGIVHRDIKPDNIIVLPDSETIKVADFGIARMNENEEAQKTQVGSVLGTPRYMSPEQALGDEVDGRSDLFSVGVILYEMLTGTKAFDASNMGTLMIQIAQKQPEPLKKLNPEVPAGLRQIVQKLLQKSPDKRFQTGNDLAQALISELNSLRDQQEEQKKHKYIPLKIKWTLSAVAIVAAVLLISMNVVFGLQSKAMTKQAIDSGASFAKFIATETAVPLLGEDWITLETFINDAAGRDTFAYLIVTDRSGVIRGASDTSLVGQTYTMQAMHDEAEVLMQTDDVHTSTSTMDDGTDVFNINTPILFQDTEVGTIILGLSQASLEEVKSVTAWLMFLLAIITISAVAVTMFIFGGLISKPLKAISQALEGFGSGDLDTRISLRRQDEIGEVFGDFNKMATSIQDRYTVVADELAQSGIKVTDDADISRRLEQSAIHQYKDEEVDDATILASSVIDIKTDGAEPNDDANTSVVDAAESIDSSSDDESASESDAIGDEDRTIISSSVITEIDHTEMDQSLNDSNIQNDAIENDVPKDPEQPDEDIEKNKKSS